MAFKKNYLIGLFLVLFLINVPAAATTDYGKLLNVQSSSMSPSTVYPGDTVTLTVNVNNRGTSIVAEEIVASLKLGKYFEAISVEDTLTDLNPSNTDTAVFRFKVKENAVVGSYKLPINLSYIRVGKPLTQDESVTLTVSEYSKLDVRSVVVSNTKPHLGDTITVTALIKNTGFVEARAVEVELSSSTSNIFESFMPLNETTVQLGNLAPAAEIPVSFELLISENTAPKTYSFNIDANYLGSSSSEREPFSVEVKGRPELIFSGLDFSIEGLGVVKKIMQGSVFSLSVQLDNIGEEKAKAVKVNIEVDDGITGIKEAFIGNIDEDDSGAAIFDLAASRTATEGLHSTVITIIYLDELGQEQTFSETVELYVNALPPESPIGLLFVILLILIVLFFIIKMVFRQLAIMRAKSR